MCSFITELLRSRYVYMDIGTVIRKKWPIGIKMHRIIFQSEYSDQFQFDRNEFVIRMRRVVEAD